jgi:vacuolar-type H+-ATPase subunit E/Vma4
MESAEQEKAALISDIEADARREVEAILKEGQERAAEKRKQADNQVEAILEQARKQAREQAETIEKAVISAVELELKRRARSARDSAMRRVMDRVAERLSAMIDHPEYPSVLIAWMIEAGVGLGAASAQVNASARERALINEAMLAQVCEKVRARTGNPVSLSLSPDPPLQAQGVVLTAGDGRTAFNNQVPTRMLRRQRQIRELVYDILFTGNQGV